MTSSDDSERFYKITRELTLTQKTPVTAWWDWEQNRERKICWVTISSAPLSQTIANLTRRREMLIGFVDSIHSPL